MENNVSMQKRRKLVKETNLDEGCLINLTGSFAVTLFTIQHYLFN